MKKIGCCTVLLLCVILSAQSAKAADFFGLGQYATELYPQFAHGTSADGSIVVGDANLPSGTDEAFLWSESTGLIGLGQLPDGPFQRSNSAAVSANGLVVVGYADHGGLREAFYWTNTDGMQGLGHLPGGGFDSQAFDVSADGSVIVGFSDSSTTTQKAFRWTESSGMVALDEHYSVAFGISDDGSVIVGHSENKACLWSDPNGFMSLGVFGHARATSSDGTVVVGWSYLDNRHEAFRWTESDGMIGLGDLPGGRFESQAFDVSGDGSVIVGIGSTDSTDLGWEAFIWKSEFGMKSLQGYLSIDLGLDLNGWHLVNALGISRDGKTIVGCGINPEGHYEAFVANISSREVVELDIKPGSCPNPLNTKSKGVLPAAILGTADFDVTQVDVATVRLEGISPLRSNLEDVATPFSLFTDKEDCSDCTDEGPDGFLDLTLKFDAQEVVTALGDVTDRECRVLTLTGNLMEWAGGNSIAGEDVVVILMKGKAPPGPEKPCEPAVGIPRTGQTISYYPGDDGALQMGVPWPDPRFIDNGDGTVRDELTGLIWLENANCFGPRRWVDALTDCNNLASGECGLSDGSSAGDWHLPSIRELESLIDYGRVYPALPAGHPFTGVMSSHNYWSSSTYLDFTDNAWVVDLYSGSVSRYQNKWGNAFYVWPVRGGN
jgi:probable HAF family extracellular repeat protein